MGEVCVLNRRGSFTVEAAFLMPMFLFMLSGTVEMGINLYQEAIQETEQIKKYWAVEDFYKYQLVEEVIGNDS